MLKGFKDFLFRGNIIDLAIAVVIGGAFTALIGTFTKGIIQPIINAAGGSNAASGLGFYLKHSGGAGVKATFIDFGVVINGLITFVITAAVVYFVFVVPMAKIMERAKAGEEPEEVAPSEDVLLLREIRDSLKK